MSAPVPFPVYEVYEDTSDDGRGPTKLVGRFLDAQVADMKAEGKGAMGSKGPIVMYWYIQVGPSQFFQVGAGPLQPQPQRLFLDDMNQHDAAYKSAIAKLTDDEKKALGLK